MTFNTPTNEHFVLPSTDLLTSPDPPPDDEDGVRSLASMINDTLMMFGLSGNIVHIHAGPLLTTFEYAPGPGVTVANLKRRESDIAIAVNAESVEVEPDSHTGHVNILVPDSRREIIQLRKIIQSQTFLESSSPLTIAVGSTVQGREFIYDLRTAPHLLIAGTTGSGKSIFLHALILSLLFKSRPDEVRLVLITPDNIELGPYNDIPQLAAPIVLDAKSALRVLTLILDEINNRQKMFASLGSRDLDAYNKVVDRFAQLARESSRPSPPQLLPRILIIIDDFADLFNLSQHEADSVLSTISRSGRAVGVHLVIATQRPSVDVITGSVKASFPVRIALRVASQIDSQVILDEAGAEDLLGSGDMLFSTGTTIQRVHAAFVEDLDIYRVVEFIKSQGAPNYLWTNT